VKINWGHDLDPPLVVMNRHDLERYGFERLKHRIDEFGWRGFIVVTGWHETVLAVYRRW
jgi:hypothetical protein